MLLNRILPESPLNIEYQLIDEKPFEALGLIASKPEKPYCIFLDDDKYIDQVNDDVTMIITTPKLKETLSNKKYGLCIVEKPRIVFFEIHNYLSTTDDYQRETFKTVIGSDCTISPLAYIADKNVKIGNNVTIEEFVSIKENTVIGDNTIIRAGSVIGGQGFEFKRLENIMEPVLHVGGVIIHNNVEIQQNNCVDKAVYPWDNTIMGQYSKTDNLVHIAHGVKIGKRAEMAACVMIAGRVEIGDDVWIGPSASIINGISIGNNANISLGSVVTQNVKADQKVTGNFAIDHKKFIQFLKTVR